MQTLIAKCSCCGNESIYEMNEEEYQTFQRYQAYGRQMGYRYYPYPERRTGGGAVV